MHGVILFLHVAGIALSKIEENTAKHLSITWLIQSLTHTGQFEYVHSTENLKIYIIYIRFIPNILGFYVTIR